jgi:glycosyltransferase involved in cell wall biosynthesis
MRIAIVANHLALGGAERQATLWARECAAMGHEVVVVVLASLGGQYELPDAIEVAALGKSHAADLPRVVRRLRAVTRDHDLAIAFQVYPALCCALTRTGRPWFVVAGNDPRHLRELSRVPAPLFRWAFGRAALACAPTRGIADCHERLGYRPRGRWLVVPNIVDREAFVEPNGDKHGILFVGRLPPEKNPQLAVDAAAAGFVERPWQLYAGHRVLLVTSRHESFGNMIVESLAAGTPVVSVDCDFGPRELIGRARYSHLGEPDPARLGELLRAVLARPYTEAERQECLELASGYRPESVAPLIRGAVEEARS